MPEFKDIGKASKDLFKKVNSKGALTSELSASESFPIYGFYPIFSHSTLENWTLISRLEVSA